MKNKIIVGLFLAAIAITFLYFGGLPLTAFLSWGAIMGMWEYYGLLRLKNVKPMMILGILFGLSFIVFAFAERYSQFFRGSMGTVVSVYVFSILVIQFWQIVGHRVKYSMVDMAATVFGSLYIGAFMSFFVLLMNLSDAQFPDHRLQNRLILFLPMGITNGYVVVTLGYLLTHAGVSVAAVAGLVSVSLLPQTWKFFWAPMLTM